MQFALSNEQMMIQETAKNFLANVSTSDAIRSAMATDQGYDPSVWQTITQELLLHAITIPEEYGGLGLSYVELTTVMEQMGRFLCCSPYFSSIALVTNALLLAGTDQQKTLFFEKIVAGDTATLASVDRSAQWSAKGVSAYYEKNKHGFLLNGEYRYVIDGHSADILILAARERGSIGEQGISLFIVDIQKIDEACVIRDLLPTMDQTRKQASININNLQLSSAACMQQEAGAWSLLKKTYQLACIALAAEQVGGAEQVLNDTLAYLEQRRQFDRKLSSFQALKHKAADMQLKVEVGRSAIYYAACVAQEALAANGNSIIAAQLAEASSMAKAHCSEAYFYNAGCAIQMHGGVGFTWEYDTHLYFKRAKASQHLLGDASYHYELIAQQVLDASFDNNQAQELEK